MSKKPTYEELEQRVKELEKADNDRVNSEKELKLLLLAVDQSIEGVSVVDLDGNLEYLNNAFAEMHGYSAEELVGKNLFIFHTPEQMPHVEAANLELKQKGSFKGEIWHVKRDGTVFPTLMHNSLIRDDTGKPIGMMGILRDITDIKQTEEALRESEEKYRFLVENANVGIFIAQNGVFKFSNIKLQALLGYSADELVKIPYKNLVHPGDKHLVKERQERKLQGKELNSVYSLRIINKAEEELWVEINSITISWEGQQATLNFARDITLQKKLEAQLQQAQKMESIGTLAGGIAHNINNLMTTIIGNAHILLMSTDKDDSLIEGLEDIKSAGERAADLTRQILAFSRKQMIQATVLDLNEVLTGIESMLVRLIEEHIELKTIYEPALRFVKMDPAQIDQVVMNLVTNARDAMPNGGTLTIETANVELGKDFFDDHGIEEQPGYYVMLSVTDTGTGMDERTQEHMFEPFYTTKEVDKGSGLGLSTVYGIVKQNDGFIQIDSEIGRGSTFKIYLPVAKDDPGQRKKT